MKIAITADLHLKDKQQAPERYGALSEILSIVSSEGIGHLVIAGDLFDRQSSGYSEFEKFLSPSEINTENIFFHIIPGNHDSAINQNYFSLENIRVYNHCSYVEMGKTVFLFIPYMPGKSIGDVLAENGEKIKSLKAPCIVIGHGDYIAGLKTPNPYEPGIYMPLTRKDMDFYKPEKVLLGHIHKKLNLGKVYYPGSPCGLDINETGKRSFLVIDSDTFEVSEYKIKTGIIYLNETILSMPVADQEIYIRKKIKNIISINNLEKSDFSKVNIRLKVYGYTSDKNILLKTINEVLDQEMKGFSFYKNEKPDLSQVSVMDDPERVSVLLNVSEKIRKLKTQDNFLNEDSFRGDTPENLSIEELVLEKAMQLIFKT